MLEQAVLAVIGLSAGVAVSGGLFAFIVELGVVADFADRTHTGNRICLYEDCTALGGILGNLFFLFAPPLSLSGMPGQVFLLLFGALAGVFTGCWAMALAEILNVYPVFMRRFKAVRYLTAFVISVAVGKGIGTLLFFFKRW